MDPRERLALTLARDALDVNPAQRGGWLRQHCGGDAPLAERVAELLRQIDLGHEAASATPATVDPLLGERLGPFRIVERIGKGGMGVVYRGVREGADFAQQVALKLIRRGFDFDDVQTRFLRERRILARLNHPNLARFIDGGVAADGRPWFALEYVEGDTITRWCDAQRLSVRDRVRLFLDVCATVQYAHAQLVVHRDLKPANVLVGGDGTVRLLDFGIARLLDGGDDAPATLATLGVGHALTPEYAAPEQFLGETAGAGTDVYSLGVILYELVTGALPYVVDRGDLVAAQRTVLETLPDAPTQAIARSEAGRPDAGTRLAARRSSIAAFRSTVRGDLSRILDKALAKEPARRYTSVEAFAADLGRWLTGEPVHVSGNGVGYRLRKFIGRHRLVVALGALALTVAAIGLTTTVWQMREARIQRNDALAAARRADAVRDYLMLMLGTAGTQQDSSHIDVREVFRSGARRLHDEFRDQPRTGQSAALMLSDLFLQVADLDGAGALLEQLLQWPGIEDNPEVLANARYNLAQIEISRGHATRARELLQQAQDWWRDRPGDVALLRNESASTQAKIERAEGRADQAIATLRDAVAERARLLARPDFESGNLLNALAIALLQDGQYEEAQARAADSHAVFVALGRADSDGALAALNSRCNAAVMLGHHASCAADYANIVATTRALYGDSPKLAAALNNLGVVQTRLGQRDEALAALQEAQRIALAQTGPRSPLTVTVMVSLAELHALRGDAVAGGRLADAAHDIARADYASNRNLLASTHRARAQVQLAHGDRDAARAELAEAERLFATTGASGQAYIRLMAGLRKALADS